MFKYAHVNFNVMDLEKSVKFYEQALGMTETRRKEAEDGSFKRIFVGNEYLECEIELTWFRDWAKDKYDLGDNEIHIAFITDDIEKAKKKHVEMGCYLKDLHSGIYYITDPDGYMIEILPPKK